MKNKKGSKTTKVIGWSDEARKSAVSTVMIIAKGLIAERVFDINKRDILIKIMSWIIAQTNGFRIPIKVNFLHNEAATLGYLMTHTVFHPEFSNYLFSIKEVGATLPSVATGWDNGPNSCYLMISDLDNKKGRQGYPLDGVKIINIMGKTVPLDQIVQLSEILA